MLRKKLICTICCALLIVDMPQAEGQVVNIIPYPNTVVPQAGHFRLDSRTMLVYDARRAELQGVAISFLEQLQRNTGLLLAAKTDAPLTQSIRLYLTDSIADPEAYELTVTPATIMLRAKVAAGMFYGLQSLLQLCTRGAVNLQDKSWQVPALDICDAPAFGYRGLMLDVSRHFLPLPFVKKLVDLMAMQKMNQLHMHLTDDQGWRLEIKKFPLLTSVGAVRYGTQTGRQGGHGNDNQEHREYYTQQEMRELVAYARQRFVNIVPEIEMPGHSSAAIAAYPALSCFPAEASPKVPHLSDRARGQLKAGAIKRVAETWGVFPDVLCPSAYTFGVLQDILDEVMDIFPSPYIHIGGDECPKEYWKRSAFCQSLMQQQGLKDEHELQRYFIDHMGKYLHSKGRKFIGWDEILDGGLADNAMVMSWRGTAGGIAAAKQGHYVVMSPLETCYLNLYQSEDPGDSIAWGGLLPLEKVYQYQPVPKTLTPAEARFIAGVQGNLWTEYVKSPAVAEFMLFPRAIALAEVAWTRQKPGFDHFTSRLLPYLQRPAFAGVNYAHHLFSPRIAGKYDAEKQAMVMHIEGVPGNGKILYSVTKPGEASGAMEPYTGPFALHSPGRVAVSVWAGSAEVGKASARITINKATGQRATLARKPHAQYAGGGEGTWNNGIFGSETQYGDQEWLGWNGDDFIGEIAFRQPETISRMTMRFFHQPSSWVYLPAGITVYTSGNGVDFTPLPAVVMPAPAGDGPQSIAFSFAPQQVSHVRIVATNYGKILQGMPGAGQPAWLFADELVLE
jgi:hexosaminidase